MMLTPDQLQVRLSAVRFIAFDFDGVFTDNMVYVFEDGSESVRCSRADGIGLRKLERLGIEPFILSSEPNPVVAERSRKLAVCYQQGCEDKLAALQALLSQRGLSAAQAAFVGNDINDLAVLQFVGLAIVVQDSHPDILPYAAFKTQRPGGHGAVREICDLFERVREGRV